MTSKEIAIIKAAVKSRNKNKILQPILFAILVVALLAMLFGFLPVDDFYALAVPLLLLTILLPQLGRSPKYNELVDILEKRLPKEPTLVEDLSEELVKNNKTLKSDS